MHKLKRTFKGKVVSKSGNKSLVVEVVRRYKHPKYSKFMLTSKKYHAHDELNLTNIGDVVTLMESKPISKLKRWIILPAVIA
ncbi:MAG: 30S ribosomal protein S17 [Bacteriovoracaceae bacterium]|nr:30S ribosomal protein S17 [Bacteriovoracaceae bacterium]